AAGRARSRPARPPARAPPPPPPPPPPPRHTYRGESLVPEVRDESLGTLLAWVLERLGEPLTVADPAGRISDKEKFLVHLSGGSVRPGVRGRRHFAPGSPMLDMMIV
ncbi:hypothetical protein ACFV5K_27270, partial [Streptomyces sp. NPDC059744]